MQIFLNLLLLSERAQKYWKYYENLIKVGFALFFHNFSTFLGRAGIYLEDLFVKPEYRGMEYGKALLTQLAQEENN